ncbi:MAG TPA: outer membrane beta-barrel protein [Oligoflexia bacterium]|nr:outer membrane beta-barrel protein [Oligoflexia bacterium]HMR25722.1 outer membrane beta-barrel protein [Oligoflexia bacterium]
MKKTLLALALVLATASYANETNTNPLTSNTNATVSGDTQFGIDFAMPYALQVDGNDANQRSNYTLGVDGRYYITDNFNIGGRFSFDVEEQNGTTRQYAFAPGVQYRWYTNEAFNPYVRADVPVTFRGAATSIAGKEDQFDVGVAGGLGIAWNLGESLGIQNMLLRYDFNVQYNFGINDALDVLSVEFFKVGIDYKF